MDPHLLFVYAHILMFVFWLGGDLGVFLCAQYAKRPQYSFETRATLLEVALVLDLIPRSTFVLMLPLGLQLATNLGMIPSTPWMMPAIWLAAAGWLALVWTIAAFEGKEAQKPMRKAEKIWQGLVAIFLVLSGIGSLVAGHPTDVGWIGAKLLIYGLIVGCAFMIDFAIRPLAPAFGRLATEGSTDDIERDITSSLNHTSAWVLVLYALLIAAGFLGTTKLF